MKRILQILLYPFLITFQFLEWFLFGLEMLYSIFYILLFSLFGKSLIKSQNIDFEMLPFWQQKYVNIFGYPYNIIWYFELLVSKIVIYIKRVRQNGSF